VRLDVLTTALFPDRRTHHWSACTHEAAHAVVAIALGLKVASVDVDADHSGTTTYQVPVDPFQETVIALSGSVAERLTNDWLDPWQYDQLWTGAWQNDLSQVKRCVGPLDILRAFQQAEALVNRNLAAIQKVAGALLSARPPQRQRRQRALVSPDARPLSERINKQSLFPS
jgi:hypothetical protein